MFGFQLGLYLSRQVVIEHDRGDWLVMLEDGAVHVRDSAVAARRLVAEWDRVESAKRDANVVTVIEWRNVPEGFAEPEES